MNDREIQFIRDITDQMVRRVIALRSLAYVDNTSVEMLIIPLGLKGRDVEWIKANWMELCNRVALSNIRDDREWQNHAGKKTRGEI